MTGQSEKSMDGNYFRVQSFDIGTKWQMRTDGKQKADDFLITPAVLFGGRRKLGKSH